MSLVLRLLAPLLLLGLLLAPAAAAVDPGAVADRLADDPLLVDPDAAIAVDESAVREALAATPVPTYVVVLPQAEVDDDENGIDGVLLRVVEALDDPRAVVVVVTDGGELQAGDGGASGVTASALLDRIVQARSDQEFDGAALTGALLEFADAVARGADEGAERGITSSGRRAVGVTGLVALAVVGGGALWVRSQRRARRAAPPTATGGGTGSW